MPDVMLDEGVDGDWTQPGIYQVARDVFRVPLPMPGDGLRAVNCYLVRGEGGLLVIDPGWNLPSSRPVLEGAFSALDSSLREVREFLVTHVHRDHYSLAVALRTELEIPLRLGIGEQPSLRLLTSPSPPGLAPHLRVLREHGAAALADRVEESRRSSNRVPTQYRMPDEWLIDGQRVRHGDRALTVVATPGHTQGHVVFHDVESRLLFAGDHVLSTITPSIGFEPAPSTSALRDFLSSLAVLRSRDDALLLPAHGPVTTSVHRRVDELVVHHGTRLDDAERALVDGSMTALEVATVLRWTRRARRLDELDDFNQMLAVLETVAHLDLLAAQGRINRDAAGTAIRYTTSSRRRF
jgi:glyoxylase-like metal-dependent hydrolase (beta-lactamase superfamily II)